MINLTEDQFADALRQAYKNGALDGASRGYAWIGTESYNHNREIAIQPLVHRPRVGHDERGREAFVVIGVVDHESSDALAVFLDQHLAENWATELSAYRATHPGWWADDASIEEREAAIQKLKAWGEAHPAGMHAEHYDRFLVEQFPLRGDLSAQPGRGGEK
ncbi:hypothetical protein [Pseudomonas rhizoryzae]|uniref:hypothetical protein n=1 Tax=Pseudomonas rhizoryzae TaxID=2571129 RepID=UPI0010C1A8CE|nr:hypothetical protein [Pseudomonas rhizoryzae]